jgi:hypothetical protein
MNIEQMLYSIALPLADSKRPTLHANVEAQAGLDN